MTNIIKFNTKHTWVKVILSKDDRVILMPFSGRGGLTVNIIRRKEAFTKNACQNTYRIYAEIGFYGAKPILFQQY